MQNKVVFVLKNNEDREIVVKQLMSMHLNNDELDVVTKSEFSLENYTNWIVIDNVIPNKERALILDHAGNIERLGFHTDPTPDRLDDGTHQESKQETQEREEKLPSPCPQCHALKPAGTIICPACGFSFKKPNEVIEADGELKQLKKSNREYTPQQKIEFYGGLKYYGSEKGKKEGWAAHKYRAKLGVFPNAYDKAPSIPPSEEVKGFISHCNIKYAKSKRHAHRN